MVRVKTMYLRNETFFLYGSGINLFHSRDLTKRECSETVLKIRCSHHDVESFFIPSIRSCSRSFVSSFVRSFGRSLARSRSFVRSFVRFASPI